MEEEAKKRLADRLASNYLACQNGTARPSVLRVYEAFVKKYPEAQITGIGVPPDDERKLSVCLDGDIVYIATYNPLTNSVDVVEKGAVSKTSDSITSDYPKKNNSGCLTACLIFMAILLAIIYVFNFHSDTSNNSSAPKVTAMPTATAPSDDVVAWVSYYAKLGVADDVSFRSVEETTSTGEKILVIKFFLSPMSTEKHYRVAAAQTIIWVGEPIRSRGYHNDYDSVNFLFYGGFIDQYGNRKESLGIRAWYTREELSLLNFDYFDSSVYSNPDAIIKAADDYIIHPAYQD